MGNLNEIGRFYQYTVVSEINIGGKLVQTYKGPLYHYEQLHVNLSSQQKFQLKNLEDSDLS